MEKRGFNKNLFINLTFRLQDGTSLWIKCEFEYINTFLLMYYKANRIEVSVYENLGVFQWHQY